MKPIFDMKRLQLGKMTTGSQDRESWVNALYKISYPVIHNLANGTLKKNMPLQEAYSYLGLFNLGITCKI